MKTVASPEGRRLTPESDAEPAKSRKRKRGAEPEEDEQESAVYKKNRTIGVPPKVSVVNFASPGSSAKDVEVSLPETGASPEFHPLTPESDSVPIKSSKRKREEESEDDEQESARTKKLRTIGVPPQMSVVALASPSPSPQPSPISSVFSAAPSPVASATDSAADDSANQSFLMQNRCRAQLCDDSGSDEDLVSPPDYAEAKDDENEPQVMSEASEGGEEKQTTERQQDSTEAQQQAAPVVPITSTADTSDATEQGTSGSADGDEPGIPKSSDGSCTSGAAAEVSELENAEDVNKEGSSIISYYAPPMTRQEHVDLKYICKQLRPGTKQREEYNEYIRGEMITRGLSDDMSPAFRASLLRAYQVTEEELGSRKPRGVVLS